jgi:uncharacterized membrane protein YqjE
MHTGRPGVQEMEGRPMASWASIFLDYLDLKAHLLAVESKEAIGHLTGIFMLLAVVVVVAVSSVLMYAAFLLFLISLLLHLTWGWSALICGVILTVLGIIAFFLLGMRLRKPIFQLTLKDLAKDKQWLIQPKTKTP